MQKIIGTHLNIVVGADPISGEIEIDFNMETKLQMKVEHGIKEASTEIFLYQINKRSGDIQSNPEFVQQELEKIVDYFATSVSNFLAHLWHRILMK